MNKEKARAFLKWLFCDPIQFWILIIIIIFQWSAICFFNLNPKDVNNYLGLALQIIGGLIVLGKINGNIELFKHIDIKGEFLNWVNSCPCIKKHYKLNVEGSTQFQGSLSAVLFRKRGKCNTIDELQEELHQLIENTRNIISQTEKNLMERIRTIEDALKKAIEENSQEIQKNEKLTRESAIGDYKWEILGVLLVLYGAIIARI